MVVRSGTGHPAVICFTHRWLLASVSAIAMFAAAAPAHARPLGGGTATPSAAAIAAGQAAQLEASTGRAPGEQNALKRATLSDPGHAGQPSRRPASGAVTAQRRMPNIIVPTASGLPGDSWSEATACGRAPNCPPRSANGDHADVTVKQTQQKAILEWETFNVGGNTELYFDQRAGGANASEWIALNRVLDNTARPSKILGSIKADGQVYIINRNGIIFGGASQVNVGDAGCVLAQRCRTSSSWRA